MREPQRTRENEPVTTEQLASDASSAMAEPRSFDRDQVTATVLRRAPEDSPLPGRAFMSMSDWRPPNR
jgi:hypothetical protein